MGDGVPRADVINTVCKSRRQGIACALGVAQERLYQPAMVWRDRVDAGELERIVREGLETGRLRHRGGGPAVALATAGNL